MFVMLFFNLLKRNTIGLFYQHTLVASAFTLKKYGGHMTCLRYRSLYMWLNPISNYLDPLTPDVELSILTYSITLCRRWIK